MILGLDIGTTSVSGVLVDPAHGNVVGSTSQYHNADVAGLPPGCHEQCPRKILDVTMEVVRSLANQAQEPVEHIALTGQMHGIMAVDADLNPVTNLITWRDQRTADCPDHLRNHPHTSETGCFLHPGYGGLTLHKLLEKGDLPENAHKVLSIAGFIAAALTGTCSIDETFAASWGIWNARGNTWHDALLAELRIPVTLLPDFAPSCGNLAPVMNPKNLGLATRAMMYSPVGDNQAGVAGVLNPDKSEAVVNLGTSGQLSVPLADYAFSPKLETRPCPGGRYIQIYAALCGGWSYAYLAGFFKQVIEQLGEKQISISDVYNGMQAFCQSTDACGLTVDTRFAGERTGTQRSGAFLGIDTKNLTPENLTRGCINGMVDELASAAKLVNLTAIDGLVAVGNAVRKNPLVLTALQEQFGLPCRMVEMPEEAATGAVKSVVKLRDLG
ncbi:MAG: hypothetical protein JXM70_05940 [Pirellulales bacterium]|nr:hypothetical protein [Pirellulales bacterium]